MSPVICLIVGWIGSSYIAYAEPMQTNDGFLTRLTAFASADWSRLPDLVHRLGYIRMQVSALD